MTEITRRAALGAMAALPTLSLPRLARAQAPWPDRPVRLVVPFGPGGAIDTLSRTVAQRFSEVTGGGTIVVENRPGAAGTIAGAAVAREKPDGLTLMMADIGCNAIGRDLYANLPYDPVESFTPVIHLVNLPAAVIANPSTGVTSLQQMVDQAKARPGGLTYSSAGSGNGSHLFMALLLKEAGIEMVHVPYRSGAEMVTALVRGDAGFGFPTVSSALGMVRGGQARALAIGNPDGTPVLPEVPPVSATLPGFDVAVWHGIVAPAGMEPALVRRINEVFAAIVARQDVRDALAAAQAARIVGGTPEAFAAHIRRERERWSPVIKAAGIKAD